MNNTKITLKCLAAWISSLMEAAEKDEQFSVSFFKGTENEPFNIVGGWMKGFSNEYSDLLCISRSNPEYAMCVKIATNEGPYAYADFEALNMPTDKHGNIDNTCIALEREDDPETTACFFLGEWERIMEEHQEVKE